MTKEKIITVNNLKKSFGHKDSYQEIFSDLDLEIYQGDFTVIMGPSGAGKSTLMYLLSGMDRADSGNIKFNGQDISKLNSDKMAVFRRKNCGYIFQDNYLIDKMSLMDNVLVAGFLTEKNKKQLIKRARELFFLVHIDEETQKKTPAQISGGEAQRAAIVRGLINQPTVLFADEPTGALNSAKSKAVLDLLDKVNQRKQSIIMVTHDKSSALRGNRIIYIKDGIVFGECHLDKYKGADQLRRAKFENFLQEMGW